MIRVRGLLFRECRLAIAAVTLVVVTACEQPLTVDQQHALDLDAELREQLALSRVSPVSAVPPESPAMVELGRALFFDKILSGNRDVSCATCHEPLMATGDGRSLSVGTGAVVQGGGRIPGGGRHFVPRNAPSLLNLTGLPDLFWDSRISEIAPGQYQTPIGAALPSGLNSLLAVQAMFPVVDRTEMRGDVGDQDIFGSPNELAPYADTQFTDIWDGIVQRLLGIEEYVAKFAAAYPKVPVTLIGFEHAANAIASFQAQEFSYFDSPFDRYLAGQDGALSVDAKRGALIFFTEKRCSACHFGPMLGSRTFAATATPQLTPEGDGNALLDEGLRQFLFRVPPLRNVELTAPYMHAGSYATLESVVRHYNDVAKALHTYDATQLDPSLRSTYRGDPETINALLAALDARLRQPFGLNETELADLVTFLRYLTDPAARDLSAITPLSVPSGLPVR